MFVCSVRSSKIKATALILLVIAAAVVLFFLSKNEQPAANDGGISLKAGTQEERVAFLSQFGWKINEDPVEVAEVVIPAEFDETYEKYNALQKMQDLDLSIYAGERVKQYTFTILNYPGHESDDAVRANLLIFNGMVVGGDVSSIEQNGFMQTFDYPEPETAPSPNA